MLIWCIHDFPAYGLTSGQVTKGYKGCLECGPHVTTRRSTALGKNVYMGHRRYLSKSHPYCRLKRAFDGREETRPPPRVVRRRDIVRYAKERMKWQESAAGHASSGKIDPVHRGGVKRLSAFYKLLYWQVCFIVT
jgi:hypothetical protein